MVFYAGADKYKVMISLKTSVPGPRSARVLEGLRKRNGGWGVPHPLVFSGKGEGAYCQDIDGNVFLDFASQVASNPLGYNYPELLDVIEQCRQFPVKFAGQDFSVQEHLEFIEVLLGVSPRGMDAAFIVNSGAEAVENAIKVCFRGRPTAKLGVSMEGAFHGRTLGALSLTNSKRVQKEGYPRLPALRLPFTEGAGAALERVLEQEAGSQEIGFVILECVQGEGGYNIAPKKLVKDLRAITREHGIPLVCDEVQAGLGRTGEWWSFQHYGIVPDLFTSAKALQVGAVVSSRKMFPGEAGALSSTWGGGHVIDLALGLKTIQIIRKRRLLESNIRLGKYCLKRLGELPVSGVRGLGLMAAFDLPTNKVRDDVVIECAKNGLLVLGCGTRGIRIIPSYTVQKEDLDAGFRIIGKAVRTCLKKGFRHRGQICQFMHCGDSVS